MNTRDAAALIEAAVGGRGGVWADIGAGEGTFTRALATLLGPTTTIYAVDRDADAMRSLHARATREARNVIAVQADFSQPFELPGLGDMLLDGMLIANALHFVRHVETVLARLAKLVRLGGRVVIVEYDQRAASRWVPNPIPIARLPALANAVGLSAPTVTATRPSEFRGILYAAAADRLH